uniref:Ig-like domain-containing protein n=1 Tax=Pundamilia nyererei TaxID=303518 RepID=A0A3B4G070_9CICH
YSVGKVTFKMYSITDYRIHAPKCILSITMTKLGDNVTLTCKIPRDDVGLSYWYKLNFGSVIETIASGSFDKISLKGPFNNSRFNATKVGDIYSLTITNATKEDEATYLCQAGTAYIMEFFNSTLLVVDDTKTLQKSFTVKQTSDVESVHLGDTMTLQCSLLSENKDDTDQCPDEDNVHWFKGASESHPGSIYHGSLRNKEDGRCDYSLSKTVTNSSDAGTYYCAVVTCGQILFGEGTEVEIGMFLKYYFNICLKLIVQLQFALTNLQEGEEVGVNYAALDFPSRTRLLVNLSPLKKIYIYIYIYILHIYCVNIICMQY